MIRRRQVRGDLKLCSLSASTESALKLVKDAIILIQVTQLLLEVLVDVDLLDRLLLVPYIPDLQSQVISGEDVLTVLGEFDIGDGGDDFGEEGFGTRVFLFLED